MAEPRASIRDEQRYEAMRRDGMDKEKAARIANTDAQRAGERGGGSPPYEEWTSKELYERARDIGVDGRSSMNKQQLIDALRR